MSSHLADLMAHRESTAEKYYRLFDKRKSSVKASQALHGMMRETEQKEEKQESKQAVEQFPENNDFQDKCVPRTRSPWNEDSLKAVQALFQEESQHRISVWIASEKKSSATLFFAMKTQRGCMIKFVHNGDIKAKPMKAVMKQRQYCQKIKKMLLVM